MITRTSAYAAEILGIYASIRSTDGLLGNFSGTRAQLRNSITESNFSVISSVISLPGSAWKSDSHLYYSRMVFGNEKLCSILRNECSTFLEIFQRSPALFGHCARSFIRLSVKILPASILLLVISTLRLHFRGKSPSVCKWAGLWVDLELFVL